MMDENRTFMQRMQDATLHYAGLNYLAADACLFAHGAVNNNKNTMATAAFWALGGLSSALFGKKPSEYQLKELSLNLAKYLQDGGINIPHDSQLHKRYIQHGNSTWNGIQRFAYNHPSELLNTVYGIGAGFLIRSGFKPRNNGKGDWKMSASGALVLAGALIGLLAPENEQKPDQNVQPSNQGGALSWLKEKPLRVSAALYTLNNGFLVASAYDEQKTKALGNSSYLFKYAAAAAFLSSNLLLSLSDKDRSQDIKELPIDQLTAYAADIIARQPNDTQEAVLNKIADYMANIPVLAMDKNQALAYLNQSMIAASPPLATVSNASSHARINSSKVLQHSA